ncbi:MAG: hypothetical protein WBV94_09730 [Blastocatellia bacterium]
METKLGASVFQSQEVKLYSYEIPHVETGEIIGQMFLAGFKQPVLDKYRDIRNGEGRKRGDEAKARAFLFKKVYRKFEFTEELKGQGAELDLGDCPNETEWWLKECEMVVDAVIIKHLGEVFPDVDVKK